MKPEQEIVRAHDLLDAALHAEAASFDADYRMILVASLDVLAWILERPEGEIFQSVVDVQETIALAGWCTFPTARYKRRR